MVYIYQILSVDKYIKIGTSKFPLQRVSDQRGAYQLKLLKVIQGSYKEEHALHKRFKKFLVPGTREFFRPEPEILAYIDSLENLQQFVFPEVKPEVIERYNPTFVARNQLTTKTTENRRVSEKTEISSQQFTTTTKKSIVLERLDMTQQLNTRRK